ncbi:hypothetical protein BD289DRAFT_450079 [Coniella lustricola]|uniref:Acyl-protein thioesterase 1 n=1 Tax=Coniella lustricola TaxID=2025994 RepID=A0A2T3AK65_9PEZI|nr:hypothetical protein BD289DRAFT_450079 [Coniella lustricola]
MEHIVVGGLSQGCAVALHVLLNLGEPVPLAAFVEMSGWLPFAETLNSVAAKNIDEEDDEDGFFGTNNGDDKGQTRNECNDKASMLPDLPRTAANIARGIASFTPPLPLSTTQQISVYKHAYLSWDME